MKEDSDDKDSRLNEQITRIEKGMTKLEDRNNKGSEIGSNSQEDQNQRGAAAAGFHDDTTEQDILKEIKTTIGMSTDQVQIKCPAKPITRALLQFTDNDERDKFFRSGNISKKRGRNMRVSPAMDAEERFHQKRLTHSNGCFNFRNKSSRSHLH